MKYIMSIALMFLTFSCIEKGKKQHVLKKNAVIEKITSQTKDNILVCAHRSYHTDAPENSLESIRKAIDAGIDFVELDVRTTKDSILVIMHDATIDRTTTGKGKVSDYTFDELQQFNLKMEDSVTNSKIPLVLSALKLLRKSNCTPNLDLKAVNYKQLHKMLTDLRMQHKVISFIGKKKKVMEMITIDSLYATLPLVETKEEMIFYQRNTKSSLQHFTDKSFTIGNMNWIHNNGELVFVNTLWDEDEDFKIGNTVSMDSVIALRPAIIQTDYPKKLVEYLRSKKLHN